MHIINTQKEFDELCTKLLSEKVVCIDTEFCRRNTYYAVLSLIQIATFKDRFIVDVLSGIDISAFKQILLNESVCKVLHAPDQDLDIFLHIFNTLPKNLFDTQIAANILGFGDMMSYANLCKKVLNVNLDKSMQKANWLDRPLTNNLLNYAVKDVEFLPQLYKNLLGAINAHNLFANYQQHLKKLLSISSYKINLDKVFKKAGVIDQSDQFKEEFGHFIMLREECAQELNIPRGRCASENLLLRLYDTLPTNESKLLSVCNERTTLMKQPFKTKLLELCSALYKKHYNY